jgi:light-regulated signal transduction histidine kinase (bacteriophytochrome)
MSVTRVNYDATFCGKLPLTQINTIQPHGVLLLLSKNGFNVLQASENADAVFKISAQDIVNKPFQRLIGDASFTAFTKQCAEVKGKCFVHFSLANSSEVFVAVLQDAGEYFLLEIETKEFSEPVENKQGRNGAAIMQNSCRRDKGIVGL